MSKIIEERLVVAVAQGVVPEVEVAFKVMAARLHKDGSIYLTIYRCDKIGNSGMSSLDAVDGRLSAVNARDTKFSVHPNAKSDDYTMIKSHVNTTAKSEANVYLGNAIKVYDSFIPIALVATSSPRKRHALSELITGELRLINYKPAFAQLRTFVFVSRAGRHFDQAYLEPDMRYASMDIGEFTLHFVCTLWPYPSTNDGSVHAFSTKEDPGPQLGPCNEDMIVYEMRKCLIAANGILSQYVPRSCLPRHGMPEIEPRISWVLDIEMKE
jgi:hypothetical protein